MDLDGLIRSLEAGDAVGGAPGAVMGEGEGGGMEELD